MSYLDRLRPASFITPQGDEIFFLVNTLERSGGKKGVTQEVLDSDESISQDQGNKATSYPINAYFTGADYDLLTDVFYQALELNYTQDNPGFLLHPRWGDIPVLPFTWSQREELISGAMVGRIDVTFRRVFPTSFPTTEGLSISEALANIDELEAETLELAAGIDVSTAQSIANIAGKIRSAVGVVTDAIGDLADTVQAVTDTFEAIQSEINTLIDDVAGNIVNLMSATQRLIRAPGRIVDSTLNKVNSYKDMVTDLADGFFDENETSPVNNKNNAIMMELVAGFGVSATAEAGAFTDFNSRPSAVSAIDVINEAAESFNDTFQTARTGGDVTTEYSGDHNFFSLSDDTVKRVNEIILNQAFDLKAEKSFILKNNSDILTLAYENYKSVSDETIDFFIETNRFVGDEYIELPAGREIVVYV